MSASDACTGIAAATDGLEVGLLILVAGANTHSHEFLDGDLAEFQRVINLNVSTPLALVHHYGQAMRARRRGGIVLLGSLAGYLRCWQPAQQPIATRWRGRAAPAGTCG